MKKLVFGLMVVMLVLAGNAFAEKDKCLNVAGASDRVVTFTPADGGEPFTLAPITVYMYNNRDKLNCKYGKKVELSQGILQVSYSFGGKTILSVGCPLQSVDKKDGCQIGLVEIPVNISSRLLVLAGSRSLDAVTQTTRELIQFLTDGLDERIYTTETYPDRVWSATCFLWNMSTSQKMEDVIDMFSQYKKCQSKNGGSK
jgi:hypothetical protein